MCCNKETYNFIEKIIDNTENLRILKNWINIKSKFSELKLEILGKSKPLQKLKDNCCLNIGKTDYTQLCSHIKIALGKIKERYENLNDTFENKEKYEKNVTSIKEKITTLNRLSFCRKDIYYLLDDIYIQDFIDEIKELVVHDYLLVDTDFKFNCFESWNLSYTCTNKRLTIFANLLLNFTELKDIYIYLNSQKFNSKVQDSILVRNNFLRKVNEIKSLEKIQDLISKYNNVILGYEHDFKTEVENVKIAKKLKDEESLALEQKEKDKMKKKKAKKKESKKKRRQKNKELEEKVTEVTEIPKIMKKEVKENSIYDFISKELNSSASEPPSLKKITYKITEKFVTSVKNNDVFRYLLSLMTFFGSKVLLGGHYILNDIDSNLHSFLIENKETEHIIDLQSRENVELIGPIKMFYELNETSFGDVLVNKFDIILSAINKNEYYSNKKYEMFDILLYLYKVIILVKKIFNTENLEGLDTVKYLTEYNLILKRIITDCNKIKFNTVKLKNEHIENIKNIVKLALECRKAQLYMQKNVIQAPSKKVKPKVSKKPDKKSLNFKESKTVEEPKEISEEIAIEETKKRTLLSSMKETYEETNNNLKESLKDLLKIINMTVFVLFTNSVRGINTEISVLYKHDKLSAKEIRILKSDLLCFDFNFDEIEDFANINIREIIKVIDIDRINLFKTSLREIGKNIVSSLPADIRTPTVVCDRSAYFGINTRKKTFKKSEIKVLDIRDTCNNNILKLGKIDSQLFLLEGGTSKDYYFSTNLELFTIYLIKEEPLKLIPVIGENINEDDEPLQGVSNVMMKTVEQMITKNKSSNIMRGRTFLTSRESEPSRRPKLFGRKLPVPQSRTKRETVDADSFMKRVTELNLEFSKISNSRRQNGKICIIDKLIDDIEKRIMNSPGNILGAFESLIKLVLETEEFNMKFKFSFKNVCEKIKSTELHRMKNINKFITVLKKILSKSCYYSNYEQTLNKF